MKRSHPIVLLVCIILFPSAVRARIIYVRPGATGNGMSWGSALGTIQAGVNAAQSGDQVWVATGTYRELVRMDRASVALYGGFAGSESDLSQRPASDRSTVDAAGLSGSVVKMSGDGDLLDGFIIRNGNASGVWAEGRHVVISHNRITGNKSSHAGGICAGTGAIITHNVITGNRVSGVGGETWAGGGISAHNSAKIQYNIITDNVVEGYAIATCSGTQGCVGGDVTVQGGGLFLSGSGRVADNVISNNSLLGHPDVGGTTYARGQGIFWRYPDSGAQISNNTIIGNNIDCLGVLQVNNLLDDAGLVDPAAGDYHLQLGSKAIDAGDNSYILPTDTDLEGNPRIAGVRVDLGAYEFPGPYLPATHLSFEPIARGRPGVPLPGPPTVLALNANGQLDGNYSRSITVSLKPGSGLSLIHI